MKCDELKKQTRDVDYGLGPISVTFYEADAVDDAIAELKAQNERLKKCEIWMKQHFYCEEVIACESVKNRRLKRALWLARSERAFAERRRYCAMAAFEKIENDALRIKWCEIQHKCLKKAKEYK